MAVFDKLGGIGHALSGRNCAIYLTGMFISLNGSFVFTVAIGWLTWELTHSAGWVGTIVFSETLPNAILAPLCGAIVDRGNPLNYQRMAQFCQGIIMAVLTVVTLSGWVSIELLLAFAFAQGIFNAFAVPAHFAMMPLIVERRDISAVMALQSACAQSARFLGPAIAAGFLVTLGAAWAFAFNAATFFIYVATLAFVHIDPKAARAGKQKSVLSDTIEGFAYAWNHTSVRMLILVATCSAFMLRPVIDLMPAFVGDVMGLGTEEGPVALAWLLSSTGASALIASLWLAQRNESSGLTHHMLLAFLVSGICIVLFSLQSNLILGVALMVVFGFSSSAANVSNQILLQIGLDDRIRARVMGIYSLTFRAVPAVGALVVGTLGSISSLPLPIMAGGGLSLVFWLWVRRRIGGGRLERSPGEAD